MKKAKLPRKRKKKAIKAQGRKWYMDTIRFYHITQLHGTLVEPVCKFWVNASIKQSVVEVGGRIIPVSRPTRFW